VALGLKLNICIANIFYTFSSLPLHEVLWKFLPTNLCLMPCLHERKCSQTCPRHKLLLVEQTGGKFAHLFKSQKQQATKMKSVVFDRPRYVHVLKNLCFITTFDYLNGWKDFYMLRDINLAKVNRYLVDYIFCTYQCKSRGRGGWGGVRVRGGDLFSVNEFPRVGKQTLIKSVKKNPLWGKIKHEWTLEKGVSLKRRPLKRRP